MCRREECQRCSGAAGVTPAAVSYVACGGCGTGPADLLVTWVYWHAFCCCPIPCHQCHHFQCSLTCSHLEAPKKGGGREDQPGRLNTVQALNQAPGSCCQELGMDPSIERHTGAQDLAVGSSIRYGPLATAGACTATPDHTPCIAKTCLGCGASDMLPPTPTPPAVRLAVNQPASPGGPRLQRHPHH